MRAMWSLHRFTRSRRTSDCALHTMMHEVPADNVMRHDTADFPPLLPMAAHSLTQSTHKSRSAAECPETSRRRCWKLSWVAQVPPRWDVSHRVIGGSAETLPHRLESLLYPCMSNANGACLRSPKSTCSPKLPRTHWAPTHGDDT